MARLMSSQTVGDDSSTRGFDLARFAGHNGFFAGARGGRQAVSMMLMGMTTGTTMTMPGPGTLMITTDPTTRIIHMTTRMRVRTFRKV